jgi:cysteinyl-tRNA synthetase
MDNGKAYAIEGDVYFSVESFPEYLSLSGRKFDQNQAGARVAFDTRKRNPADFALWKVSFEVLMFLELNSFHETTATWV